LAGQRLKVSLPGIWREELIRPTRQKADSPQVLDGEGAEVVVREIVKTYGRVTALRGVSFTVAPGEFVAVTGPSGSGKSTLLNLIGTLDEPDSGTIAVDGRPVPSPRAAVEFRRRLVGFVFQDNLLLPYLSAQNNVETALLATGFSHERRRERSKQLLDEVGLSARVRHLPSELSAGERQRVAIARALANDPRLLLADEPTGALDSASSDRILGLLAATRERHGMTMIIASHDPVVTGRADRVVRLIDGTVNHG
jgi:putative ABC transport system ATP-binding protein